MKRAPSEENTRENKMKRNATRKSSHCAEREEQQTGLLCKALRRRETAAAIMRTVVQQHNVQTEKAASWTAQKSACDGWQTTCFCGTADHARCVKQSKT